MSPEDVLTFWFTDHGPDDWFAGTSSFDDLVRTRFGELQQQAEKSELFAWRTTPGGRLAEIIVLDEPTSSLDARAEYEAFQRFIELTEGKTAVLISHRFFNFNVCPWQQAVRQRASSLHKVSTCIKIFCCSLELYLYFSHLKILPLCEHLLSRRAIGTQAGLLHR